MKLWQAIIGMVGILILICAPVVANALPPAWLNEPGEPPESGFGSLSINSDPSGANVFIDDQYKGTTPLTISGLPTAHIYNIALTMQGYRTYSASVHIRNGKTSTVSATLTPIQIKLPSGYVSSNSKYLPTPTAPFISPWGPRSRSAVDVYLMLKASDLDAILTSLFS